LLRTRKVDEERRCTGGERSIIEMRRRRSGRKSEREEKACAQSKGLKVRMGPVGSEETMK